VRRGLVSGRRLEAKKRTMRGFSKTMLRTCAGFAVAAGLVVGGAGIASAAPVTPVTHTNSWYGCNRWAQEQWNLNGPNTIENNQFSPAYTYTVTFRQHGSCLSGTMTDSYYPTTGSVYGTISGNHVRFSFTYPSGSVQGTRTFTGTINWRGEVSGSWTETGTEAASSTWSLAQHARHACPPWQWWARSCRV
jgi:hypothetical protein